MEEISLKQRDIVLIPFPFSDQTHAKVRPTLIASNNVFNQSEDIIVLGITGNLTKNQFKIPIEKKDLELRKIKEESCIKVENILKIKQKLVLKKIDSLKEEPFERVITTVKKLF